MGVPDLEHEMRQLLLQLELVSHGRTMGLDGRVTGSKDPSPLLRRDGEPFPHEEFAAFWAEARTDGRRRACIEDAREALGRLKRTPPPQKPLLEPGSTAWKREIANDRTTDSGELCRLNSISRQTLKRYRDQYREGAAA
jgi:hypothetical protein